MYFSRSSYAHLLAAAFVALSWSSAVTQKCAIGWDKGTPRCSQSQLNQCCAGNCAASLGLSLGGLYGLSDGSISGDGKISGTTCPQCDAGIVGCIIPTPAPTPKCAIGWDKGSPRCSQKQLNQCCAGNCAASLGLSIGGLYGLSDGSISGDGKISGTTCPQCDAGIVGCIVPTPVPTPKCAIGWDKGSPRCSQSQLNQCCAGNCAAALGLSVGGVYGLSDGSISGDGKTSGTTCPQCDAGIVGCSIPTPAPTPKCAIGWDKGSPRCSQSQLNQCCAGNCVASLGLSLGGVYGLSDGSISGDGKISGTTCPQCDAGIVGCITPTPAPSPVPTPVPTPSPTPKPQSNFFIKDGDCKTIDDKGYGCVTNPEYPKAYAAEQKCRFSATGTLKFVEFATEKWFDYVKIDGQEYSGNVSGTVEAKSELLWSSDFWVEGLGWKICAILPGSKSV